MCNRLDTIPACGRQTGGWTDGQTSCDGIVCAMHTHHAVKTKQDRQVVTMKHNIEVVTADSIATFRSFGFQIGFQIQRMCKI